MPASFTPWSALLGGVLIGLAASLLLIANGRVAGVSGMLGALLGSVRSALDFRLAFLSGLLIAGLCAMLVAPAAIGGSPRSLGTLAIAGLLVGVGTRLSHGCTSGHGLCGLSRGSFRSLVATVTFVAAGIVTVAVYGWFGAPP